MASQSLGFRPQNIFRQIPWSVDKGAAIGSLLILVTFSLIGWLYLGQASIITSSTLRVDDLRQEIHLLTQQNNELVLEIARLESIAHIEGRAKQLGFRPTDASQIRYLMIDTPIVLENQASEQEISILPQPNGSFWDAWATNFKAWVAGTPTN